MWEFDLARNLWFWIGGSLQPDYTVANYNSSFVSGSPIARTNFGYFATSTGMWIYGGRFDTNSTSSCMLFQVIALFYLFILFIYFFVVSLSDLWFIQIGMSFFSF
jgi:hypothetical protein